MDDTFDCTVSPSSISDIIDILKSNVGNVCDFTTLNGTKESGIIKESDSGSVWICFGNDQFDIDPSEIVAVYNIEN